MATWDDPDMEPKPWGFWDYVTGLILTFGLGCLVGAIITMQLT